MSTTHEPKSSHFCIGEHTAAFDILELKACGSRKKKASTTEASEDCFWDIPMTIKIKQPT